MNSVQVQGGGGMRSGNGDEDYDELVASSPQERNWRGMAIAFLVIAVVCSLIVTAVIILTPPDQGPGLGRRGLRYQIADIGSAKFEVNTFDSQWISDHELVYRSPDGSLLLFDVGSSTSRQFISNVTMRQLNAETFAVSADRLHVLLGHDTEKDSIDGIQRRYHVYSLTNDHAIPLMTTPSNEYLYHTDPPSVQCAEWAPTGSGLVYLRNNDIYYTAGPEDVVHKLTDTGIPGVIFNGLPDYLYKNILPHQKAIWWSPDGRRLLYASFNDSALPEWPYARYDASSEPPSVRYLRYPPAGQANPEVSLHIVDLKDLGPKETISDIQNRTSVLIPPPALKDQDPYLVGAQMVDPNTAVVIWMNRIQNMAVVTICKATTWFCQPIFSEKAVENGWIEAWTPPLWSQDGMNMLMRIRWSQSPHNHHVIKISVPRGRVTPISPPNWDIDELLGWDQSQHWIYFIATPPGQLGTRRIYRMLDSGTEPPVCLTCANACLYEDAAFSPHFHYWLYRCLGPDVPITVLLLNQSPWNESMQIFDTQTSSSLRLEEHKMARPQTRNYQLELRSQRKARLRLLLPPGLRDELNIQCPVLVQLASRYGEKLITDEWLVDWSTYLAVTKGYAVLQVDLEPKLVRSSLEDDIADTVSSIKHVLQTQSSLDATKVAVYGWKFGGWLATQLLRKDVVHCGIAVSPITNWQQYVSYVSEQLLGYPNNSFVLRQYSAAGLSQLAHLKDKKYFLIQGTIGLYAQQGMAMAHALARQGLVFDHLVYPDEDGELSHVRTHMYTAMDAFLADCFGPPDDDLAHLLIDY